VKWSGKEVNDNSMRLFQTIPHAAKFCTWLMKLIMVYSVDYPPFSTSSTLINHAQDLAVRSIMME
jgi:hypothetical protein